MPGKDYGATRYSGLAQITAGQRRALRPVWTFSTGVLAGPRRPAAGRDGTMMYVVTPFPTCSTRSTCPRKATRSSGSTGPDVDANALGMACCDAINRGAFYADGKIVYNLLDGHTIAVDARTGRELWNTKVADLASGETTPMAPLVAEATGSSSGLRAASSASAAGPRALDLATGTVAWTAHNVGPDAEMLVSPGTFKPFYDQGTDLGRSSWPSDAWKTGRRAGMGLALLRPGARPGLFRRRQPGAVQRRAAPGRQQVDQQRPGAPARAMASWSGPTSSRRTTTGTTTPTPR